MSALRPAIDTLSTVGKDGQRNFLHPAEARGAHTRRRAWIQGVLVVLLVALPFIPIGGHPAILLDVAHRRFFIFGATLGPTDSYMLFFLLSAVGFSLIVASALWGRVWCGYACPQTVFLEGVFRRIERLVEGSREEQIRLDKAAFGMRKLSKKVLKNALFVAVSVVLAHVVTAYFIGVSPFAALMAHGPSADPALFTWIVIATGILFFNFAWFREQLCIIICPYGRLQSALSDDDTVMIGYDARRGEPRGKRDTVAGDCVDCNRCVAVCPTGIDIRQGSQLECVGCASCIDACDEVMIKIGRAPGLIRYDSERGLRGEPRRFWRPRLALYGGLALAGLVALVLIVVTRPALPVTLLHQPGSSYTLEGDMVQNIFVIAIHNPKLAPQQLAFAATAGPDAQIVLPQPTLTLASGADVRIPLFVRVPRARAHAVRVVLTVGRNDGAQLLLEAAFIAPQ